jgi:hypothetical protein
VASDEAVRLPGILPRGSAEPAYRFLSPHQAAVLDVVTRHLIPEPPLHVVAYLDRLLSLYDAQTSARRMRIADLRDLYSNGLALLDELAGGDFTAVPRLQQGLIVSHTQVVPFTSLLFGHIVEAAYAPPQSLERSDAADHYHETG